MKDIEDYHGNMIRDQDLKNCSTIQQSKISTAKNIKFKDLTVTLYVKIKSRNSYIKINCCRSNKFYEIPILKKMSRSNMASIFSNKFNFKYREVWKCIYNQTKFTVYSTITGINILPTGISINSKLDVHSQVESDEHMLYRIHVILLDRTYVTQ